MKKFYTGRYASITVLMLSALFFVSCNNGPKDEVVQDSVTNRLQANPGLNTINVAVAKGVVTLSGTCQGDDCNTKAEDMIKNVDGVKSVDNKIEKAAVTDMTLRTSVQEIISKYEGVQADVLNGEVVLRGSVERSQIQPLMTELSSLKPKRIDNQLAVK